MSVLVRRLAREFAFAGAIPPTQIARRIWLRAKRRVLDRPGGRPLRSGRAAGEFSPIAAGGVAHAHGLLHRTARGWRAEFLGRSVDMGPAVDWFALADDPRSRLWRMNLNYFEWLPGLETEAARALITDWIARVRPGDPATSLAAWTPYAVSLRLSSWLAFLSKRGPGADAEFRRAVSASLVEQARHLEANLETDIGGNHLIKNLRALIEVGAALGDDASIRGAERAQRRLLRELRVQILPDGMHYERSPSYHAQVFSDLLAVRALTPEGAARAALDEALGRMARALALTTHPDGRCALFGDAGLSMGPPPSECLAVWPRPAGAAPVEAEGSFALPDAGFYGARVGGEYVVFRMGRLGPDALMAHAHCDWGAFEWSLRGRRVVVDQGVFEYEPGSRRDAARASTSHNTVVADGAEQADLFGAFRCGARPSPEPAEFTPTAEGLTLSGRLLPAVGGGGATLARQVRWRPGVLQIADRIEGGDPGCGLTNRVLLHPEVRVEHADARSARLGLSGGAALKVRLDEGEALSVEDAVWWPDMGVEIPTRRLVARGRGGLALVLELVETGT